MSEPATTPTISRLDQATLAVCLVALLALFFWRHWHAGGFEGRLIDIDRSPATTVEYRVDVNIATWPELAQLPDIGEVLARRIVEHRERQGPFLHLEDLRRVRGIGPRTLEKLRPYLAPLPVSGGLAGQ